jgi:hypothetical protein
LAVLSLVTLLLLMASTHPLLSLSLIMPWPPAPLLPLLALLPLVGGSAPAGAVRA